MEKPTISVIILDYLKAEGVLQNVQGVLAQTGAFELEVIVVDNSNNADNQSLLNTLDDSRVKVIINNENLGYTVGNNIGAEYATGDYMVIVNPDIEWKDTSVLQHLLVYLKTHEQVGIVGPKQVNPDRSTALTIRAFPTIFTQIARRTLLRHCPGIKQLVRKDEMLDVDHDLTQEVDWIQSSFLFLRKSLWDELNGFDERYFLFLADTEMCWQTWKKGQKVVYLPEVVVYADGIRCSDGGFVSFFTKWVMRQHLVDSWLYTWKHRGEKSPR